MNRHKITRESLQKAKQFLKGLITKSFAPPFAKKFEGELETRGNTILFRGLPLVPIEDRTDWYRKEILRRDSKVPLNKEGFHALQKIAWGLTRSSWIEFLKKQKILRATDRDLPEPKKAGRKARSLKEFQCDLFEVRRSQMPPGPLKKIKDSYVCVVVHRTTSLLFCEWIRNKTPQVATPAVIRGVKKLCKIIGIPKQGVYMVSDFGFEFDSERLGKAGILHKAQKIAHSVEARIGTLRRHLFKQLKLKKGSFKASLQQTMNILNEGMRSKVSGKTPLETAQGGKKNILEKFNSKRAKAGSHRPKKIDVGDRVRMSVRNKKDILYKSNSGIQWDPRTYTVLGKSKNGMSFKLKIHVKLKNKWQDVTRWIPGNRLQKLPPSDDTKTERILAERLQSGSVKKAHVRRRPSPPKRREKRPRKAKQ